MKKVYNTSGLRKLIIRKASRILDYLDNPKLLKARLKNIPLSFLEELVEIKIKFNFVPDVIIDVGANKGEFTKAAKFLFPYIYICL